MKQEGVELQPSETRTSVKNFVFLIKMIMPKKQDELKFLDKRKTSPGVAGYVMVIDAQEWSRSLSSSLLWNPTAAHLH